VTLRKPGDYRIQMTPEEEEEERRRREKAGSDARLVASRVIKRSDEIGFLATKIEAGYRPAMDNRNCANCVHFREGNTCSRVAGTVYPNFTSDYFEEKPKIELRSKQGSIEIRTNGNIALRTKAALGGGGPGGGIVGGSQTMPLTPAFASEGNQEPNDPSEPVSEMAMRGQSGMGGTGGSTRIASDLGMTPLAKGFISRCIESGMTENQIKTAIDKAAESYSDATIAELRDGLEKAAGLEQLLPWAGKLFGIGSKAAPAASGVSKALSTTSKALPAVSGSQKAVSSWMPAVKAQEQLVAARRAAEVAGRRASAPTRIAPAASTRATRIFPPDATRATGALPAVSPAAAGPGGTSFMSALAREFPAAAAARGGTTAGARALAAAPGGTTKATGMFAGAPGRVGRSSISSPAIRFGPASSGTRATGLLPPSASATGATRVIPPFSPSSAGSPSAFWRGLMADPRFASAARAGTSGSRTGATTAAGTAATRATSSIPATAGQRWWQLTPAQQLARADRYGGSGSPLIDKLLGAYKPGLGSAVQSGLGAYFGPEAMGMEGKDITWQDRVLGALAGPQAWRLATRTGLPIRNVWRGSGSTAGARGLVPSAIKDPLGGGAQGAFLGAGAGAVGEELGLVEPGHGGRNALMGALLGMGLRNPLMTRALLAPGSGGTTKAVRELRRFMTGGTPGARTTEVFGRTVKPMRGAQTALTVAPIAAPFVARKVDKAFGGEGHSAGQKAQVAFNKKHEQQQKDIARNLQVHEQVKLRKIQDEILAKAKTGQDPKKELGMFDQIVNPIFQRLGFEPEKMPMLQKIALIGGTLMMLGGGVGMLAGGGGGMGAIGLIGGLMVLGGMAPKIFPSFFGGAEKKPEGDSRPYRGDPKLIGSGAWWDKKIQEEGGVNKPTAQEAAATQAAPPTADQVATLARVRQGGPSGYPASMAPKVQSLLKEHGINWGQVEKEVARKFGVFGSGMLKAKLAAGEAAQMELAKSLLTEFRSQPITTTQPQTPKPSLSAGKPQDAAVAQAK
jgi:hypothetical protein